MSVFCRSTVYIRYVKYKETNIFLQEEQTHKNNLQYNNFKIIIIYVQLQYLKKMTMLNITQYKFIQ